MALSKIAHPKRPFLLVEKPILSLSDSPIQTVSSNLNPDKRISDSHGPSNNKTTSTEEDGSQKSRKRKKKVEKKKKKKGEIK